MRTNLLQCFVQLVGHILHKVDVQAAVLMQTSAVDGIELKRVGAGLGYTEGSARKRPWPGHQQVLGSVNQSCEKLRYRHLTFCF